MSVTILVIDEVCKLETLLLLLLLSSEVHTLLQEHECRLVCAAVFLDE
jgi:hypothetical protein